MCKFRILTATFHYTILTCSKSTILASMNERLNAMREARQIQTNHRYGASTRHMKCLYQLYAQVQDIGFLLDLADHIHHSAGTSRSDNAWLLGRVLDCLGRRLKQRSRSTFMSELQEACLEISIWHNRIENTASTCDEALLMPMLHHHIGRAIRQKIQSAKFILLTAGLAEPKDFETGRGAQARP